MKRLGSLNLLLFHFLNLFHPLVQMLCDLAFRFDRYHLFQVIKIEAGKVPVLPNFLQADVAQVNHHGVSFAIPTLVNIQFIFIEHQQVVVEPPLDPHSDEALEITISHYRLQVLVLVIQNLIKAVHVFENGVRYFLVDHQPYFL